MFELVACPICGGSSCQDSDSSEPCVACRGQGVITDGGPPPAPAGDERGYLARKPCGCFVRWMSYGLSGPFATEALNEWRAKGWEVHDGLRSQLTPACTHPPGGRT
jgi:hypothetical protein